jgi:hypothetical protein
LRFFPESSKRLPDFFNKSKALQGSGDFFLAKSFFRSSDYFKSLKVFCLETRYFRELALLFCFKVTEFFKKCLLLDRLFSFILFDEIILELIYF